MSLEVKKIRVIWKEQLEIGNGEDINFLCSFDDGRQWVSFKDLLSDIRTPSINGRKIPLSSYEMLDNNYSTIDFTIPITFNSIPGISDSNCTIESYPLDSDKGLPPGEYYLKAAGITTDFVGMNTTSNRISAMSFMSKAKKFNLPERGDIKLGVQYGSNVKGLAVYIGKKTQLVLSTKISDTNTNTAIFTEYSVDGYSSDSIPIEYGSIFGSSYITSIDSTSSITKNSGGSSVISESVINSFSINEKNKAILVLNGVNLEKDDIVKVVLNVIHYRLAFISNLTTTLVKAIDSNSSDPICIDNRYSLPFSGRIRVNSEYINYEKIEFASDSSFPQGYYKLSGITRESISSKHEIGSPVFVSLLDGGIFGELPKKSISIYKNTEGLGQYFHFDRSGYSDMVPDMTGNKNGKILGLVDFTGTESFLKTAASFTKSGVIITDHEFKNSGTIHFYFKIDKLPDNDMVLFGSSSGLRLKLSKDNLRLSLEYGNKVIIKSENPKISKVKIGSWTEIAISWQHSTAFSTDRVYLYKDGILEADESLTIAAANQYYAIGGLLTTATVNPDYSNAEYSDLFEGKIDDWRVYDIHLGMDQLSILDSNLKELGFEYCGVIDINKRFVNKGITPDKDKILDYYLFDSSLLKYEPYIITYFSVLKDDEELVDKAGEYSTTCDLWPLYAIANGNYFTADTLQTKDGNYGLVIKKKDGKDVSRINYPININSIKYRFELSGKSDGVNSPIIRDFATIVSSSSIDF